MTTQPIDISKIILPDTNPRSIKEPEFLKLVESIRQDPDLLEARPVIVSDRTGELVAVAGNMRVRACKQLGMTTVPCIVATLTEEQETRWNLKDNTHAAVFNFDMLAAYDENILLSSGFKPIELAKGFQLNIDKMPPIEKPAKACPHCGGLLD